MTLNYCTVHISGALFIQLSIDCKMKYWHSSLSFLMFATFLLIKMLLHRVHYMHTDSSLKPQGHFVLDCKLKPFHSQVWIYTMLLMAGPKKAMFTASSFVIQMSCIQLAKDAPLQLGSWRRCSQYRSRFWRYFVRSRTQIKWDGSGDVTNHGFGL